MTWIMFNEPKVLQFLLDYGEVFTVRHYRAVNKIRPAKRGKQFLSFSVLLDTCGSLSDELLARHCHQSGFVSVSEWKEAIARQHKDKPALWLLRAKLTPAPEQEAEK